MKKIIVFSSGSTSIVPLVLELERLFPECEIKVVKTAPIEQRDAAHVY